MLTEEIELPGGIKDNQKIKVQYMGHAADVYTSHAGDLLLNVAVKKHDFYERVNKNDIQTEVELTLAEAILGSDITISTVHGPLNIKVDAGTSTGQTMVLKHYGVPEFDPPENYDPIELRGDHIVVFKVRLPSEEDTNSPEMRDIIDQMLKNEQENKEAYYAYQAELKKQRQAEVDHKMQAKRAKFQQKTAKYA